MRCKATVLTLLVVACAATVWNPAQVNAVPLCGVPKWTSCPGCVPHTPTDTCNCGRDFVAGGCNCVNSSGTIPSEVMVSCLSGYFWWDDPPAYRLDAIWANCEAYSKCKKSGGNPYNCATPPTCIPTGSEPCGWHFDHWGNPRAYFFAVGSCQ
jgi:hypothetical protein